MMGELKEVWHLCAFIQCKKIFLETGIKFIILN